MDNLLEQIHSPEDLKDLKLSQLNMLCKELRERLLENVSQTGGHLASNLGVVELTVALEYVLNLPKDKIIWDVGHQSYIHKMLTGRLQEMSTLRQFHGLSGFPKRVESEYDAFGCGHSSTAISAALGMAIARDLNHDDYNVVAVVGDGALTGGMSLEGINHAAHEKRNLLIILNDNEMSISKNEGALSSYLNHLRSNPAYHHTKDRISGFLQNIPLVGGALESGVRTVKDVVRNIALKGGTIFESMGINYIGPIDGHDLRVLIPVIRNSIRLKGPVLLHVITKKGKGYLPAEKNPDFFHGVGSFELATGEVKAKSRKSYTAVFTDFIMEQGEKNPAAVAITAAMADGTGLKPFAKKFPDRFFDVGICEQHAVTLAAGMACQGLHPVVCIYSTFMQRAADQVIHDVALQNLPVLFAVDRAGLVGEDGATHQGVFDITLFKNIPNLKIFCPINEIEMKAMLEEAMQYPGPVIVRYPRGGAANLALPEDENPSFDYLSGKAELIQSGEKIALLSTGKGTEIAAKLSEQLSSRGFDPAWAHFAAIKPLDNVMLQTLSEKADKFVIIEDSMAAGGLGSAVLEACNEMKISADILRIGIPDQFVEHGKVEELWKMLDMTPQQILRRMAERWPDLQIRVSSEN